MFKKSNYSFPDFSAKHTPSATLIMDKFILRIHACSTVVLDKKECLCNSCENGVFISMFKVDECICFKEIGITQAELETGGNLCITESPRFIAMFCKYLQYVGPLDDTKTSS